MRTKNKAEIEIIDMPPTTKPHLTLQKPYLKQFSTFANKVQPGTYRIIVKVKMGIFKVPILDLIVKIV